MYLVKKFFVFGKKYIFALFYRSCSSLLDFHKYFLINFDDQIEELNTISETWSDIICLKPTHE